MLVQQWFIHINGETFGPLSNEVVMLMYKQGRLQAHDFVWCDGLLRWTRLFDLEEFAPLMPSYPETDIPVVKGIADLSFLVGGAEGTSKKSKIVKVRRFVRLPVEARLVTQDYGSFFVENISEGGLFVRSETILLALRTEFNFGLESVAHGWSLQLKGRVVRLGTSPESPGFGVEFFDITTDQAKQLRAAIEKEIKQK